MIQRKAARFVFSDYSQYSSVTAMLSQLDWQSLERRRDDSILVMFHKAINQYVDIPCDHILRKAPSITCSSNKKFLHLPSRIDSFMHSFFQEQSDYGITYPITLWKLIMLIILHLY